MNTPEFEAYMDSLRGLKEAVIQLNESRAELNERLPKLKSQYNKIAEDINKLYGRDPDYQPLKILQ